MALVTGASGGIGAAICTALAGSVDAVAVCFQSNENRAQEVASAVRAAGAAATTVNCDVTSDASMTECFRVIAAEYEAPSIAVHAAGTFSPAMTARMTTASLTGVVEVTLGGAARLIRRAAPAMIRRRAGRIVLVGSVGGVIGLPGNGSYAAAKASLIGLSRSAARELAPRQVTCNVVAPGLVDTQMLHSSADRETLDRLIERVPAKRLGQPAEVAALVAFLAGSSAGFITGAVIAVDGGLTSTVLL